MQPWMLIALLLGGCLMLLIVAPRVHRRSLQRANDRARRGRQGRIDDLRARPGTVETEVPDVATAVRARQTLLLRGVRAEIVPGAAGSAILVHPSEDAEMVETVVARLAREAN